MKIVSATFVKGAVGPDDVLRDGKKQVAFIGRSNVGKSSIINSITNQKKLAITSSTPGRTRQINLFLINKSFYLVDLPGYGYAKAHESIRKKITELINWYFFDSTNKQEKVFLIIDAFVGPTQDDIDMLHALEEHEKTVIVIANKIDKIKKSAYKSQIQKIETLIGSHRIVPYSTKDNIGSKDLLAEMV